ncbi:hypothetical protein LXL04_038048 [Taraxacum kok-saghyz]
MAGIHDSGEHTFPAAAIGEINFGSSVSLLDHSNTAASNPFLTCLNPSLSLSGGPLPLLGVHGSLNLLLTCTSVPDHVAWSRVRLTKLGIAGCLASFLSDEPRFLLSLCLSENSGVSLFRASRRRRAEVVEKPTVGNGFRAGDAGEARCRRLVMH